MSHAHDANHIPPTRAYHRATTSTVDDAQASLWASSPDTESPRHTTLADEDDAILFHGLHEAYGFCSNFAAYPILLGGKTWPTVEHYFQAQKFAGTDHEEAIRLVSSPTIAARMGRSRKRPLRADWERVKDDVMYQAVRAKFAQHDELRRALLATGHARLVEHRARDAYWGDGPDGSGRNMLGQLLMRVRAELAGQPMDAATEPATPQLATPETPSAEIAS